ncbi:hypothetical protein Ancab_040493 [Ancistrocladus abbreviatus]
MSSQPNQLHFILFPFMAQGHMIPMIDMAKVLARQGITITLVTTPLNALRLKSTIDQAIIEEGLNIRVIQLEFPSKEAGLPEGCENADMLPSLGLAKDFIVATGKLQDPFEQILGEMNPLPNCIISDGMLPWTAHVARGFNIPRIVFHGTSCSYLLCALNLRKSKLLENISSDSELFVVPGLPDRIELTIDQLPASLNPRLPYLKEIWEQIRAAEEESFGVVVNTFEELEPDYVKRYKEAVGLTRVWCIGPVSLCNKGVLERAKRGGKAAMDENQCLKWLNLWEVGSVVYACLGSICTLIPSQMLELGLGLEASNRPFIWVIRGGKNLEELDRRMKEDGFEERTGGRGLVIRGWAPQVLILSHPAVGGFLTHCGWNSTLEGLCAGLPMVTWPLYAEQFFNEKCIIQVLKVGIRIGVEVPMKWGEEEKLGVLVKKEDVRKAVEMVMDESEEGRDRRRRAKELGEMARKAVEAGGSSDVNLESFIQEIMHQENVQTCVQHID